MQRGRINVLFICDFFFLFILAVKGTQSEDH